MPTFYVAAHPGSSSPAAAARLARANRRDTTPERLLRRELHARGFRFRVCYPVPGAPRRTIDIAFTRAQLAVFVDGCYWHGCPEHGTRPTSNAEWWQEKFAANAARDLDTNRLLEEAGWQVLRFWEHVEPTVAADRVDTYLRGSAAGPLSPSGRPDGG